MLPDPRSSNTLRHHFFDIRVVTRCAAICGADAWTDVDTVGHTKLEWPRRFLALPQGIPSHAAFRRIFTVLKPDGWTRALQHRPKRAPPSRTGVAAVDGRRGWEDQAPEFRATG